MSSLFRYEGRNGAGRLERGRFYAQDPKDALQRLHRRGLTPLTLTPDAGENAQRLSTVAARDLTRSLAQLLGSGLSFAQALRFAGEELSPEAAGAAARMREAAEQGEPASHALDAYSGAEARLLKGVLFAAETSGRLVDSLEIAAASFARSADLRSRLSTSLIYPAFVLIATIATLCCFMFFVVPSLGLAFEGAEDKIPQSTRTLLALSAWLKANGLFALAITAALVSFAAANRQARDAIANACDLVLASRLGLGVVERLEYSAFATLAALSLEAGVPTGPAFDAAAASVGNRHMRAEIIRAVAAIRIGERPSSAFERHAHPPKALLRLINLGEETGNLSDALKHGGALLSNEAEQRLARLGAIAGPVITLSLGGVVGSIVVSLFLGLMSMSDLAAQ